MISFLGLILFFYIVWVTLSNYETVKGHKDPLSAILNFFALLFDKYFYNPTIGRLVPYTEEKAISTTPAFERRMPSKTIVLPNSTK
jgi:hypothetical protein